MNFDNLLKWIRRSVSPVFIVMLVASFILWYIAKLSYTYTTEQTFRINIDGEKFEVTCVVEGIGTNLFGYRVYHDKSLRIPLSELRSACSYDEANYGKVIIEPQSLQNAISVRCTDIKRISIGDVPEINQPKK
ncbi:MAG: hypothetical protein II303_05440 [Alistipes sp.]|nr:hypothetical protein [Alistipes sp.]